MDHIFGRSDNRTPLWCSYVYSYLALALAIWIYVIANKKKIVSNYQRQFCRKE